MSVLSPVMCFMDRHKPVRRNVEWDGEAYVGHCRHCDKPIYRVAQNNWQLQRT